MDDTHRRRCPTRVCPASVHPASVCPFSVASGHPRHTGVMRVLLVDDEVRLAEGIRRGLEAEGMAVDMVHTGVDGLWMAQENDYDLIVLDVMMPGMSGYRVCQSLRADGDWTPILFLTAKDGEWDEVEGLDTGGDDWLTKPFSYPVLVARIRALVRRGARERPAVLEAGDLRLDPATRRVYRGETLITVTSREFAVLDFLMRRRGDIVSKRDVLSNVWNDDFEGDPNIVEVYVGHLRTKIDRPFGRLAIETVRGAGYRLASDGG
jgi:two-component system OmpR family response regulator